MSGEAKWIVFSQKNCQGCTMAKGALTAAGYEFEEIDLTGRFAELKELVQRTGLRTMPQIFHGPEFVGGLNELRALLTRAKADSTISK